MRSLSPLLLSTLLALRSYPFAFFIRSRRLLFSPFRQGPGNILTVADDLLKNDGTKFLEMMEQLAERRMYREEMAASAMMDDEDSEDDDDGSDDDSISDEDDEDDEDEDEVSRWKDHNSSDTNVFGWFRRV